ncbi:MAG: FAD/NAD(P)-binding protein [Nevskia sp.]|nr:FAD/NAD(P)-binding protein [Nevskia sp.]
MNADGSDPWVPQPWRVRDLRRDTSDVFSMQMAPLEGVAPPFKPGQFNMLYQFGQGEVAISISGHAPDGGILHTVRAVGAVTRVLEQIAPGTVLGVRGPFGNGWPVEELRGHDVVIVAGGLGLAPLRPLIEWLALHRADYGRVDIIYGARKPADLLYPTDIARWQRDCNIRMRVTVDNASPGWPGEIGAVTHLVPSIDLDPAKTLAVVCGPEVMMRFTVLALQQEGMEQSAIYLSMERHMQCAVGYCGHCFYGPHFICRDGPVFRFDRLHGGLIVPEL